MIRSCVAVCSLMTLVACASVPDALISYYPPKATVVVTVNQAVDCSADKSRLVTSNSVSDVPTYVADFTAPPHTFRYKQPSAALSDTNLTVNLTEDGRLKSINGDSTGQAEAIAKAVITAAVALAPLIGGAAAGPPPGQLAECVVIASWGGGKPVTVTYTQALPFQDGKVAAGSYPLSPDPASAALYGKLKAQLPKLALSVASPTVIAVPVALAKDDKAGPKLTLNQTASVHLAVAETGATSGWSTDVIVPLSATYDVPLPQGAPFGKVSFALTLADSGAVTTLTYGQLSGAAGPANVAAAVGNAAKPESASDRAANLKAEADEIAQNARVARCRADPSSCT